MMGQICPKCQTENITTSKFCKKCGSSLSAVQSVHPISSNEVSDIEKRVKEEKLYEQVAADLRNGIRREGLYVKALADANGSEELTNAMYIKYAVQAMKDELAIQAKRDAEQEKLLQQKQFENNQREQENFFRQQEQYAKLEVIKKNIQKGELPAKLIEKMNGDGFSILSKIIARNNTTWVDYKIEIDVDADTLKLKNMETDQIDFIYPIMMYADLEEDKSNVIINQAESQENMDNNNYRRDMEIFSIVLALFLFLIFISRNA